MTSLTFDEYQEFTHTTRVYKDKIVYPALGLTGEAGEVAEKIKKMLRDDDGVLTDERREALKKEIGDVLWYVAALAADIDASLGEIAQINVDKLTKRKEQNQIHGSGDDREVKIVQASGHVQGNMQDILRRAGMPEAIVENKDATE